MSILKASVATALLAGVLVVSAGGANAQLFNRPSAPVQGDPYQGGVNDPAALMLRIERLENQIRSLTGQLEEAQFQNRRLEDQMRRLQEAGAGSADQPFQRGAPPPQRRSDVYEPPVNAGAPMPLPSAGGAGRGRGDAFDPTQNPGAPGAPRVLGTMDRQAGLAGPLGDPVIDDGPYEADPSAPLDLLNPRRPQGRPVASAPQAYPSAGYPQAAPLPSLPEPQRPPPPRTQAAMPADPAPASTLPPPGPREMLDAANQALRAGELERAETGYKEFLQRYPSSRLAAEATFNLGDAYARRGRNREAAEQFLKVTTDFSKSAQAPQSLHRLGQSLERLGAKEQACAAWAEVPRKYPSAPQTIRAAAERDIKRASC
ncbi:MAG: tol-pal system protein YbgF [Beijerinckiaceae bacterium]